MVDSGTINIDADKYLELLDRLQTIESELRQLGHGGYTTGKTTQRNTEKTDAMVLDNLDISGIEWKKSNRDGGGVAGPETPWCWAFGLTKDGGIRRETMQLLQALEQYEKVRVGRYVFTLGGRNGSLLNRTIAKK